jgi:hypothetical protein
MTGGPIACCRRPHNYGRLLRGKNLRYGRPDRRDRRGSRDQDHREQLKDREKRPPESVIFRAGQLSGGCPRVERTVGNATVD